MTQSSPNPFIGAQLFVSSNDIREDEVRKEAEMEWRAEASLLGDGYRECLFGAVCLGITDPCQGLTSESLQYFAKRERAEVNQDSMPAISMSSHPVHFTGTPLTSKSQRKAEAMYPVPLITLSPPRDVRHTDPERSRSESSNTPLSQRSSSSPILELSHCQSGTPVQNTHRSPTLPSPYTQRDRFANNHRVQSRRQGRKVDKYEDATPGLSFQSTFLPTRERDRRAFVAQYDESPTPPTTWVVFQTPPEGADLEMQGWQGRRKDVGLNRAIRNGKKQEKRKG
ncbi:hypothetical protein IAR55_006552 [Kwoniella newhampshirensis]|uniref:Uncharacterized protein n=1 Tax=Kwoniella newhampshirensis TaxID=1651941 RepID=A0AAW0YEZ0_9TREE